MFGSGSSGFGTFAGGGFGGFAGSTGGFGGFGGATAAAGGVAPWGSRRPASGAGRLCHGGKPCQRLVVLTAELAFPKSLCTSVPAFRANHALSFCTPPSGGGSLFSFAGGGGAGAGSKSLFGGGFGGADKAKGGGDGEGSQDADGKEGAVEGEEVFGGPEVAPVVTLEEVPKVTGEESETVLFTGEGAGSAPLALGQQWCCTKLLYEVARALLCLFQGAPERPGGPLQLLWGRRDRPRVPLEPHAALTPRHARLAACSRRRAV